MNPDAMRFPLFIDLHGREAAVIGGGAVGLRRAEVLCREVNAAAGREARQLGIPFNRSDCPGDCDFFFPAICEGGGLVAGVVGDGSDHRRTALAAQKIREALGEL